MPETHFKMERIKSVLTLVTPNRIKVKIEINCAFYQTRILVKH